MWILRLLWQSIQHWIARSANLYAAALAYFAPFALVPLLALAIYLVGLLVGHDAFAVALESWGMQVAPDLTLLIQVGIENFELQSTFWGVPFIGALFVLWVIATTLSYITAGLHQLWFVSEQGVWRRVLVLFRALGFYALLIGYLTVLVFVTTYGGQLFGSVWWGQLTVSLLLFLLTISFFTASFWVLSWRPPSLLARLVGGIVIGAGILMLRYIFSWWLASIQAVTLFGAAGALIGVLVLVYLLAVIIFYGAAVAYVFDARSYARELP